MDFQNSTILWKKRTLLEQEFSLIEASNLNVQPLPKWNERSQVGKSSIW